MKEDVTFSKPEDDLKEVSVMMKKHNLDTIPICDSEQKLVGMVTAHDIVLQGFAEEKPGTTKVSEIMNGDLAFVEPDTSIDEAKKLMAQHNVRRLPVTVNGNLVGVVSLDDIQ
ncbi:CBS domain-containing protein [Aquibacillus sp. 3ASR75-11]|uniref:CBS domain-containing protein n=2 Tax=Terrihalobacillus insolitus TaxID=2950438 RepID=A0A9X3WUN5_9BACI|nr:CBS domain-containing protein [Terrihalobacillus insolitus]MDC3412804.1 CBS domain-containing protein [Terrihalobacillus insolitus]MDC3423719.1 CBS domain-containing protein [Terrihalobacillus insolitus]